MMRKTWAVILTFIYLSASVGVWINVHYCGGKVADVSLYSNHSDCGCADQKAILCCAAEHADSCCSDETLFFQLDVDQQTAKTTMELPVDLMLFVLLQESYLADDAEDLFSDYPTLAPPLIRPPAFILNCSLTYYG